MIRTRGLSHIELPVDGSDDVERAVRFYGDVFGFEVVARSDDGALLQVPGRPGSIAVSRAGDGCSGRSPGTTHFGLTLSDPHELDAAVRLAITHGATLLTRTDHPLGGATATLTDPAGHHITL